MAKTAEETREEQAEIRRADRVKAVFDEVAKATKNPAKQRITTEELVQLTGYSEGLVTSTIKLVNSTIAEYGKAGSKMIAYQAPRPATGEEGGWSVATSWAEWVGWHGTLHRHATTRVESLERFADVMEGLWPHEAQQPGMLSYCYQKARAFLDDATKIMAPRSKPAAVPKRAKRGIKVHR